MIVLLFTRVFIFYKIIVFDMKKLLIVVDYQNDFVNGSLGFDDASNLETPIYKRIIDAEHNNEDVIFTKDIHESNYLETEEGKNLPIIHCIRGTSGSEIYGIINEISKRHIIFEKETFGSSKLASYLKENCYDQITLIGLVSYICVLSNAVICKAMNPNAHIIVEKALTSGLDKKVQEEAFDVMRNIHIEIK